MIKKLRLKFIIVNMSIVTVMLAVIFLFIFASSRNNLERESIQMMRNIASEPEHTERPGEPRDDVRLPYFIVMNDNEGNTTLKGDYFDLSDEDYLESLINSIENSSEDFGVLKDYNLRYYINSTPKGEIIVFSDITSEMSTVSHMMKNLLAVGCAAFVVFFFISLFLSNWAVKPVDTAWKKQKQFIADASHELKTPLTVILTNAELLNTTECTNSDRLKFSSNILAMSDQMKGLVESLLSLARIDNQNHEGIISEHFSLSDVVVNALLPFEPVYFEKGLYLSSNIDDGIFTKGNQSQIKQVVDILLDNAGKYAYESSTITVNLHAVSHNKCLLEVSNEGFEISKEDLKNIFKRFYRADKARSMNQSYGLGLAIASTIIDDHKGKIWAESKDGINTFFVELITYNC